MYAKGGEPNSRWLLFNKSNFTGSLLTPHIVKIPLEL